MPQSTDATSPTPRDWCEFFVAHDTAQLELFELSGRGDTPDARAARGSLERSLRLLAAQEDAP